VFWAVVTSAPKSVLRRSPGNTAHVKVVNELVAEIQKVEMRCSKLELPTVQNCDCLLRPPPGRAWLADHRDQAATQLKVEQATRREAKAKLEGLRSSVAWVKTWCLAVSVGRL
jgi:hypothetical protein